MKQQTREDASLALLRSIYDYVELFVFAVIVVGLLVTFFFRMCVVSGPSMNQTLLHGQGLFVSDLGYTPREGDIIVFHQTGSEYETFNEPIVKRVIATGGHFVKIDYTANQVFVSEDDVFTEDEIIDESGYAYFASPNGRWAESGRAPLVEYVPEGYLFVMGDNRNNSADSRSRYVGLVDARRVLGRVYLRVLPFSLFGKVS